MPRPLAIAAFTALTAALGAADVAASSVAWGVSVNLPGVAVRAGAPASWGARVAVGPWVTPMLAPVAVVRPTVVVPAPVVVPPPVWTVPFQVAVPAVVPVAGPVAAPVPVLAPRIVRVTVAPRVPIRRAYVPAPVRYRPGPHAVRY